MKSPVMKKYTQKLQIKIIDFMENNKNDFWGNIIPIYYLIMNFDENEMDIYQSVHNLMYDKKIDKVFTSGCPVCGNSNYTTEEYQVIDCLFCHNKYIPENIEENLKLVE